mgnify:CR=1 FL=1
MPEPEACRLCGIPERVHGVQTGGNHAATRTSLYVTSTDDVRLDRKRKRAALRRRAAAYTPTSTEEGS